MFTLKIYVVALICVTAVTATVSMDFVRLRQKISKIPRQKENSTISLRSLYGSSYDSTKRKLQTMYGGSTGAGSCYCTGGCW